MGKIFSCAAQPDGQMAGLTNSFLEARQMAKLIAIHTLKAPMTGEEIAPVAKAVKANNTPNAYWVKSWLQMNEQGKVTRIICEWDGKDATSVAKALKESAPDLPVDGVYPMGEIQSESYR